MSGLTRYDMYVDNDTGEVAKIKESENRLWSDEKEGGMILARSYHKKLYNGRGLSGRIEDKGDLLKTYILVEQIVKDTNRIGNIKGSGFADESGIAEILGISEKKAREYLSRMIKLRVLGRGLIITGEKSSVSYIFNPVYVNSGKYVPLELYVAFQEDIDAVIPRWMKLKYEYLLQARDTAEWLNNVRDKAAKQ